MCFVLDSMLLQWIRHDLSIHLMNWGSLGLSSLRLSVNLSFVAMALPKLLSVPDFLPLSHWITTKWWGPVWNPCLLRGSGPILLNQKYFFSILLNFFPFPNMPAQRTLKWLNESCSGVRPYHYIHSSDHQLWSHSLGALSHHITSLLKYHILPNK